MSGTQYLSLVVAIPALSMVLAGGYLLASARHNSAHVRGGTLAAGIAFIAVGLELLFFPLTAFGYLN